MPKDLKKIMVECLKCKARFEIWLNANDFGMEAQERIKKYLLIHCPVCREYETMLSKR